MSTGTSAPSRQGTPDEAQQKAQEVAGQAQEKAQEAAEQAKRRLRERLERRSSQTADQVNQQASDLRAVGHSLRKQGKDGPAEAAERLAQYAERVGGYLRDKDSDALLNDAEDYARRQPWAVGVGALALGFAAARFLKASSRQRYSSRMGSQYGHSAAVGGQRTGFGGPAGSGSGSSDGPSAPPRGLPPTTQPPVGAPAPGIVPPTGV